MARVILITTRHIRAVLTGFNVYSIANQRNYHSVFFKADEKISALIRYIINRSSDSDIKAKWGKKKGQEIDLLIGDLKNNLKDKSNDEVRQLFEKLLASNDINWLKHNSDTDNIEEVEKGIQRIKGTNIFVCHEWFADKVTEANCPNLAKTTRIAYLKAIIDDIKCELDNEIIEEWVLLSHDEDFAERECDKKITLAPEGYEAIGLKEKETHIWLYQHTKSILYDRFFIDQATDKFKKLISSTDIDKTINTIIHPKVDATGVQNIPDIPQSTNSGNVDENVTLACPPLSEEPFEIINWDDSKGSKTIIDSIVHYQITGNNDTANLLKETGAGKIHIDANGSIKTNSKPIIVFWKDKPLSKIDDKRRDYLDSSIWIRYAHTEEELENIKVEVKNYSKLYKTGNAIEIKEFKARMALNSFLIETKELQDHNQYVYPFIFHSETQMKLNTDKRESDEHKESGIKEKIWQMTNADRLQWRLLIIDDNAFVDNKEKKGISVDKCKIISSILYRDFNLICDNKNEEENVKCDCIKKKEYGYCFLHCSDVQRNNKHFFPNIYIDCVRTIQDAQEKLKERRYDIVLLDYLFKEGDKFKGYGTDFLDNIRKGKLEKQVQGPFGKFWVFFISAFTNAISEQMLSDGMHYNTDYWHIARGACPTTTPELFRYNLYSLMYRQLQEITDIKMNEIKGGKTKKIITLQDLLEYIYESNEVPRERALDCFNSFLHLRAHYDILRKDYYAGKKEDSEAEKKKSGSPLVQCLFPDMEHYSNAFWEHAQHLVYITAYGTIRQWNEMWEEYVFIAPHLKRAGAKNLCEAIETYIVTIRNANNC